jgi:hypothetical protein
MPIYMEISRLHRCVTIVARGKIEPEEILGAGQKLFDAQVPEFAKIVDLLDASGGLSAEQMGRLATLLRGGPGTGPGAKRGPVAFMVDPRRGEFARAFAATEDGARPVHLFKSLREAREWLAQLDAPREDRRPADSTPWSDPDREATMFRRGEKRDVPVRRRAANAAD